MNLNTTCYPDSKIMNFANRKNIFVFIDGIKIEKGATSCIFYLEMMKKIRKCFDKNNIDYVMINNINQINDYGEDAILIIDIFIIVYLYNSDVSNIYELFNHKYVLIIGENYNHVTNTFIGWHESGVPMTFDKNNILYDVIKNSYVITYQNNKTYIELNKIKTDNKLYFFPIDGYLDEYVIEYPIITKDIDVLFYGHYDAERRKPILEEISKLPIEFVITSDIFNLNVLKFLIDRSKIIFHLNSMDNCYHVPYSKISKLLTNNKIIVTENAEEFENSELCEYVYTFELDQYVFENKVKTPLFISLINSILKNYAEIQKSIDNKNPSIVMKEKYNFEKNILSLINNLND
jgi:hypothetical protein